MDKDKLRKRVFLGILLIIIGIMFLINDYVVEKREKTFSAMNLELTELLKNVQAEAEVQSASSDNGTSESDSSEESSSVAPLSVVDPVDNSSDYETYVGILEIPKIGFQKGFYRKESPLNNVKINIKILDSSSYPDEDKGNVIIIGHSGNYSNSYFGNLYQLQLGDTASVTYQSKKYNYKIVNIYTDKKDGTVTVYRDERKTSMTLITCTKDDDTSQTIYILELVGVE